MFENIVIVSVEIRAENISATLGKLVIEKKYHIKHKVYYLISVEVPLRVVGFSGEYGMLYV